MLSSPSMLLSAAVEAGIKVPDLDYDTNPDEEYESADFPHFHVLIVTTCAVPLPSWTAHWDNAKIISEISDIDIKTITIEELLQLGLHIKT